MAVVQIPGVVLDAEDLSFPRSPWARVARANNQRLAPLAVAGMVSIALFGTRLDPTLLDLVAVLGPILVGGYAFIWMTNVYYMGEYKKAYTQTPTGGAPCDFTFDDGGMKQSGAGFHTDFAWKTFVEVTEDGGGYRFWLTPFSAVRLPYRYVEDDMRVTLDALIVAARERGDIKGIVD